jgi:Domain of unknown function (DUF4386)
MESDRRTGIVVGALFIVATAASILGSVALGSVLEGPEYLTDVAVGESQVILAVLLFLIAASSAFATAFLLFPILRRHSEGLAAGYVGVRGFENVFYVAGVVGLLIMVTVSQTDALGTAGASDLPLLGAALLALHDWSVLIGTLIFFGLGALTLNYVLYQASLVPRWMSLWGIVGAVLVFSYGLLGVFGVDTGLGSPFMVLAMPIALQEMVFAVWLMVKGFNRPAVQPDQTAERRVAAMN